MKPSDSSPRDSFSSKFGVIAAAAGSAIGLGNIWRFPYEAGANGGGAFLIVYLICIVVIGLPVMISEFIIGRSAQRNPYRAFKMHAPKRPWYLIGLMGVVAAFMILAFYTVVAGWTLEYIYQSFIGGLNGKSMEELTVQFNSFKTDSYRPLLWFVIFMGLTGWVVIAGVKNGIEKYTKVLMPILLVMLIAMAVYVLVQPGAGEGMAFLFKPDFSKMNPEMILKALGQAFFSLSIGMGTLITYGSYIRKKENLASTAVSVAGMDTFIAIMAGVVIFPAITAFSNINIYDSSAAGSIMEEGLMFSTLPNIFYSKLGVVGQVLSTTFFILLGVAALTSTISVLEVIVTFFTEELNLTRRKATIIAVGSVSVLGIFAARITGVFSFLNFTSANIFLPLGGLAIVMFVGWFLAKNIRDNEYTNNGKLKGKALPVYLFLVRYIAPIAIAVVFIYGIVNALK